MIVGSIIVKNARRFFGDVLNDCARLIQCLEDVLEAYFALHL